MKRGRALTALGVAALAVLSLAAIAVLALYIRARTKPVLDDTVRAGAPGSFVRLSHGVVHYDIAGDSAAPAVVFIHGSSAPYIIWDRNFQAIADAGYRVLRYDLYGRGYSDRPRVDYNRDLYLGQLAELIRATNVRQPVHVVGLSMGGAMAVSFADSFPGMVASLILISPAGPYLGDIGIGTFATRMTERIKALLNPGGAENRGHRKAIEPLLPAIREQLKYRGTEWATYSFLKNRDAHRLTESFERVGAHPRPGLLIWGRDDTVLSVDYADDVLAYLKRFQFHVIPGAGHASQFQRPDIVNALIISFLEGKLK